MKITSIDSYVLTIPTPQPMARNYAQQKLVVAEIATDEGVNGLGYSLVFGGGGAEAVHAYLATRLAPALIGEDPLFVERLWEKMFRTDMGMKKQGVAAYALSALDIGLWDIAGKVAGLPLYKLWGAVTDRIPAYGSGGWSKYSERELIAEVARAIKIPVATGENNYTRFEFRDLVERRAASVLMPDVCRANGFSETMRIGRHAAAHQVAVAPHVVHELSLQVVGALSNGFLVEFIDWTPPDLFEEMPKCRDGCFRVPERPGHGMALARGAKEKYRSA